MSIHSHARGLLPSAIQAAVAALLVPCLSYAATTAVDLFYQYSGSKPLSSSRWAQSSIRGPFRFTSLASRRL